VSVEGECIPYVNAVETSGEMNGVERWLLKTEEVMRKSLASITKDAIEVGAVVLHQVRKWQLPAVFTEPRRVVAQPSLGGG